MEDKLLSEDEQRQATALLEFMAGVGGEGTLKNLIPSLIKDTAQKSSANNSEWKPDLRYRSLVEKLPVVTFMASLDDTVQEIYISPQIEALLGFTQAEWLDNPIIWYRQLHPDDREMWVREFARTCSEGTNFRAEYRLVARDGRIVWVQGECQLIRDDNGRPIFLQGIAFDITHLKRAAMVEEEKLAAEAANRAKSEFLARMSHEIRTPLNGVVGMIDLLSATSMTDMQHRYAQLAREAANSLLVVINDILDFSKIEAGKVETEAIEFDLHKMIEDLAVLLAPVAAKKKLAIASFIPPEVPRRLIGDPSRTRQVLTNLITNAIKFTERGQVSIRAVHQKSQTPGIFQTRIEVQDTGMGIPPDRLDRLFKSFSQVDTSTTRKFGGTGLGLAICKRLVELMGGEIGIESEVGKGTTFWFTLKLAGAPDGKILAEFPDSLRTARVLAIESDQTQQKILAEQLDCWLSTSATITNRHEALTALRQAAADGKPFTVMLMPFNPDTSALLAEIRADRALQSLKLIAITSLEEKTETDAILKQGYVARLPQPLTQSQLIATIAFANDATAVPIAKPTAPVSANLSLKGLHVLVAEDNEMNQFVTQQTLQRVGCTCDIVDDGGLAVDALTKKTYAAILMDCQMPDVDGLEATRRIRHREAAEGLRRIPIIALTAEAIAGDREKCLAAGMDGYVSKPINAQDLFAEMTSLIKPKDSIAIDTIAPAIEPIAPAISEASPIPIDTDALLVRCMQDASFATELLEKFAKRASEDVNRLRAGAAARDFTGTERLAHNLKSVAAHVSADKLRDIAFAIEQAGATSDLQLIEQQLPLLDEEARRCTACVPEAIEKLIKSQARIPAPTSLR
jgi:PAS domain S-box-containing protein